MANEALKRACEVAGGQKPLADRIRTTQSQVWYWLEKSKKGVPAEFCVAIERETGVPRHELRPDIFPVPSDEVT
ncbi:YdaS family helix-turn-helix protein [Afipia felis]